MSENTPEDDDFVNKLRKVERGLFVGIGSCLILYGTGRLAGVIPPEVPPAWPFVAIGAILFVEILNPDR